MTAPTSSSVEKWRANQERLVEEMVQMNRERPKLPPMSFINGLFAPGQTQVYISPLERQHLTFFVKLGGQMVGNRGPQYIILRDPQKELGLDPTKDADHVFDLQGEDLPKGHVMEKRDGYQLIVCDNKKNPLSIQKVAIKDGEILYIAMKESGEFKVRVIGAIRV